MIDPTASPLFAVLSSVIVVNDIVPLLSSTGASLTGLTVIVATRVPPPRPASPFEVEAWMVKLPLPLKLAVGVNFRPALPSAKVRNVPP